MEDIGGIVQQRFPGSRFESALLYCRNTRHFSLDCPLFWLDRAKGLRSSRSARLALWHRLTGLF